MKRYTTPLALAAVLGVTLLYFRPLAPRPEPPPTPPAGTPTPSVTPNGGGQEPAAPNVDPGSGLVTMQVEPSHRLVLPGAQTVHAAITIATSQPGSRERPPLNLALVIDRSGSMGSAGKIDYARKAAAALVDALGPKDRLAIVTYDGNVDVLAPAGPVADKNQLHQILKGIEPGGSTNLGGGLTAGIAQVAAGVQKGMLNRVLLMTDGRANTGPTSPKDLCKIATSGLEGGISVTSFGLGADYNEDLLLALAEAGGGNYHFIEDPETMQALYAKEMTDLFRVVGRRASLTLTPGEGVHISALPGPTVVRKQDGSLEVKLGDLYGGKTRQVVLRVEIGADVADASTTLVSRLVYESVEGSEEPGVRTESVTLESSIGIGRSEDAGEIARSATPSVLALVESFQAAEDLERATRELEAGHKQEARKRMVSSIQRLQRFNESVNDERLGLQVQQMQSAFDEMNALTDLSDKDAKLWYKRQKATAYEVRR